MRRNRYSLFECYANGRFLFRSFGHDSAAKDPRPESNVAFRAAQMTAKRSGHRLTYLFLATGLARSEAAGRLERYGVPDQVFKTESRFVSGSTEFAPVSPLVT
jgi:hypothetical protein